MPGDETITFTFVGDIMPAGYFSEQMDTLRDQWIPDEALQWFQSDVVFANLECVASNSGVPLSNKIVTYCFPEALEILKDIRVDVVNLANNHQMDYGIEASEHTRSYLDELNIAYGGVGRNIQEATSPVILERKGYKIGFLFHSWTNEFVEPVPAATSDTAGVAPLSVPEICDAICKLKLQGVDIVIVSLHWGEGKSHNVRPENIYEAHKIIDAGADIIVGHHAHCLQGYEVYKGKPIFYGLGNFFCSAYRKLSDKKLTYEKTGTYRYRFIRERKTVVVNITYSPENGYSFEYHPLYQLDNPPALTIPDNSIRNSICMMMEKLSRRIAHPDYGTRKFPLYRRMDELKRIWEDFKEVGIKLEYFHPRTPLRIMRKLLIGKSCHILLMSISLF